MRMVFRGKIVCGGYSVDLEKRSTLVGHWWGTDRGPFIAYILVICFGNEVTKYMKTGPPGIHSGIANDQSKGYCVFLAFIAGLDLPY